MRTFSQSESKLIRVFVLTLFAASGLSGCYTAKHSVESPSTEASLQLPTDCRVYVSVPADGRYEATTYANSGMLTATAFYSSLSKVVDKAFVGKSIEDHDQALASAGSASADYLFAPTILHWEDRATEWSGKADKMELTVVVIDVATGTELDRAVLKGSSSWFTLGGDHPQDMLPEPVDEYVASIFAQQTD